MTPITKALCNDLIDEFFDGRHEADAAADYAQHIPVRVTSQTIGIPVEAEPMFTGWAVRTLQEGLQNLATLPDLLEELHTSFIEQLGHQVGMEPGTPPDHLLKSL